MTTTLTSAEALRAFEQTYGHILTRDEIKHVMNRMAQQMPNGITTKQMIRVFDGMAKEKKEYETNRHRLESTKSIRARIEQVMNDYKTMTLRDLREKHAYMERRYPTLFMKIVTGQYDREMVNDILDIYEKREMGEITFLQSQEAVGERVLRDQKGIKR